ncbi:MAG: anti-sigma factor antagonist [Planctomycetes bacterium]|nr:anti-sigma factor antagonist [Planctomycetota bacterium]
MPDLTIQVQEVKNLPGTALVILNGSIDAKTVITFQTHLNSVKERGVERFIMDMENVKYVNSTGLGYLINLSDSVTPDKGGISLVKVQPKVKVVFDMLGLNAFFRIFSTRDEALKHLQASDSGASPNDQTVVLKSPVVATPPPPPSTQRHVVQQPAPPPPTFQPQSIPTAPLAGSTETLHVECQACRALLAVKDIGTYKCPRCLTSFNYSGGGRVNFLPRQKSLPVQLSLSFSPECMEGLLEFVKRFSTKSGFSPAGISEMQMAVKDTVEAIRRHAYGGNENNVYHVLLTSVDSELEMRFADYGASLNSDKGDVFSSVRRTMDRFELRHHPKGGNVVTVSKKAK